MIEAAIINSTKIIETIHKLNLRIQDRFPNSSLLGVGEHLYRISETIDNDIRWIERPNYLLRVFIIGILICVLITMGYGIKDIHFTKESYGIGNIIQIMEAGLNMIVLAGAAGIFLVSIEIRKKRNRVIKAINRLRSVAHVIDMHQLTKDPEFHAVIFVNTPHSPKRELTPFEMSRYLDYCAEMLSLTSKIGFLYIQTFDDSICVDTVNKLEQLTIGMSLKIWQKIDQIFECSYNIRE